MEKLCELITEAGLLSSSEVMDHFLRRLIKTACFSRPTQGAGASGGGADDITASSFFVKFPVGSNEGAVALLTALCEQVKQTQIGASSAERDRIELPEGLRSSVVYDHVLDMIESLLDGGERARTVYVDRGVHTSGEIHILPLPTREWI